jgi:hypothetical protein
MFEGVDRDFATLNASGAKLGAELRFHDPRGREPFLRQTRLVAA